VTVTAKEENKADSPPSSAITFSVVGGATLSVGEVTYNSIELIITNPEQRTLQVLEDGHPFGSYPHGQNDTVKVIDVNPGMNYYIMLMSPENVMEDSVSVETPLETGGPAWPEAAAITVIGKTDSAVALDWPNAEDESGVQKYRICVHDQSGNLIMTKYADHSYYADPLANTSYFTITGLNVGTEYTFKLRAVNTSNLYSEELSCTASTLSSASSVDHIRMLLLGNAYKIISYDLSRYISAISSFLILRTLVYEYSNTAIGGPGYVTKDLFNPDGSIKYEAGIMYVDCQSLQSSLYKSLFLEDLRSPYYTYVEDAGYSCNGGCDHLKYMGMEVDYKTDGNFDESKLRISDLIIYDYKGPSMPQDGRADHVLMYAGNGLCIDIGHSKGPRIIPINFHWTSPTNVDAYGTQMIITVRRFIKDDGKLFIVPTEWIKN
jgi:hypothetical protein